MGRFTAIIGPVIAGYLLPKFPPAYGLAFMAAPDGIVAAACIGLHCAGREVLDANNERGADAMPNVVGARS